MAERQLGPWLQEPVCLYFDGGKHWCCPAWSHDCHCFPWVYLQDLEDAIATPQHHQGATTPTQQIMYNVNVAQAGAMQSGSSDGRVRRCVLEGGRIGQPQPPVAPHPRPPPPPPPLELPPVALHQLSIVPHRPQHQHPTYGHGQYSQKLIRWDAAASGTSTRRCNHPPWNWTGDPWWNPHGEGVQLHNYNIVDMHCHSRRQSLEAILFKDEGCYVPRDLHQTLEGSADSTIWYQMACRGSKYRGFQATCKYCGACSIGAWKPRSTHEWRKHQRANILHFLGYNVHVIASETDCVSGKNDLDYMYMAA